MKPIAPLAAALLLLAACHSTPDRNRLISDIDAHEQELATFNVAANEQKAHEMVALYRQFATHFPEDSLAPVYLMRSAEIFLNTGENENAVALLDSVITLYPGFEEVAACLFLKGNAYENSQQYDLARETYTQFVADYPDHYLAEDTRKMLPYIGLSPEEMLDAILNSAADL